MGIQVIFPFHKQFCPLASLYLLRFLFSSLFLPVTYCASPCGLAPGWRDNGWGWWRTNVTDNMVWPNVFPTPVAIPLCKLTF